jgi:hypothetical protein
MMATGKALTVALAVLSGWTLGNNLATARAKESQGLELRPSLIDRFPPHRLKSAARDLALRETKVPLSSVAQIVGSNEAAIRQLEARGYRQISGLVRRGDNFIAQAKDQNGVKVRVVMNARTGEIVGLSRILKKK